VLAFEPETSGSHPKSQKTWILAWFQMKS